MRTGMAALLLAGGLVLGAQAPVELGPTLTAAPDSGSGFQGRPAAAFGSGLYLVAWQDGEDGADPGQAGSDIACARISKAGKTLDPAAIVVCKARGYQKRPRVAFGGGLFLVVWDDCRSGRANDIYAARVTPQGKVLDPDGFPVATGEGRNQTYATVASDGQAFLVAWMDFWAYPTYGVAAARVTSQGKVLDRNGVLLAKEDGAKISTLAEAARRRTTLGIPWALGAPVRQDYVGSALFPALTFARDRYLLYFRDHCVGWGPARVVPVDVTGRPRLHGPPKDTAAVVDYRGTNFSKGYDVAFVGGPASGWLLVGTTVSGRGMEHSCLNVRWTKPDGTLCAPRRARAPAPYTIGWSGRQISDLNAAGAFDGKTYWLVFENGPRTRGRRISRILATRIDPESGQAIDLQLSERRELRGIQLSEGQGWAMHPAAASDGAGGVLAVWADDRGADNCRLRARLMRPKEGK